MHKQAGKRTSMKITSKPLLTKGNTSKKKGLKKPITSAYVRKDIGKWAFLGLLFSQTTLRDFSTYISRARLQVIVVICYRMIHG